MCGFHMPKQHFTAMVHDSNSHTLILWHVISMILNIGKKLTGIEILTLHHKKIYI